MKKQIPILERFMSKIQPEPMSGCWLWTTAVDHDGYGRFAFEGKTQSAHRVSWRLHNGDIPEKLCVLHKCDIPACVNPEHLFLGTIEENMADMVEKGRAFGTVASRSNRFTEKQVLAIYAADGSYKSISDKHNASTCSVARIKRGTIWNHVTGHKGAVQ